MQDAAGPIVLLVVVDLVLERYLEAVFHPLR